MGSVRGAAGECDPGAARRDGRLRHEKRQEMYIEIDFSSDEAIYQQLCNQIIMGIATSQVEDGEVLPSVRELADEIGINMHTVNKAYSVLKQEGFVKVDRRKGAVVSVNDDKQRAVEMIRKELEPLLAESYCRNLTRGDVKALVDEIYDRYEGKCSGGGKTARPEPSGAANESPAPEDTV